MITFEMDWTTASNLFFAAGFFLLFGKYLFKEFLFAGFLVAAVWFTLEIEAAMQWFYEPEIHHANFWEGVGIPALFLTLGWFIED